MPPTFAFGFRVVYGTGGLTKCGRIDMRRGWGWGDVHYFVLCGKRGPRMFVLRTPRPPPASAQARLCLSTTALCCVIFGTVPSAVNVNSQACEPKLCGKRRKEELEHTYVM